MAKKPIGMEPAIDIVSYDAVPWYRKQWFALFPLFIPAMLVVVLTGDVFLKATPKMKEHSEANVWRYTSGSKAFFIAVGLIVVVVVISPFLL